MDIKDLKFEDYPFKTYDKIRYRDTDRQDHVNNAVFSTFLETGRVEFLYNPEKPLTNPGCSFVIANINLDLLSQIKWPGKVDIGTAVTKIGNSSIHLFQALFQDGKIAAAAKTVIVQIDEESENPKPLSEETKKLLEKYLIKE